MAITVASLQARLLADVSSFSKALQQAQKELDQLGRSGQMVDAGLGRANGALQHLERDLKPARVSVGGLSGALTTATAAASGFLAGYLGLQAIRAVSRAVLDATMAHERITSALRIGAGSAEAAGEAYDFVRGEARRLGVELETSASQFGKLSAAARGTSLEGDGARRIFSATAEAATVLGLSSAETSGMLNAFQQMISKGKVQAEELRGQLGERLPGAFQMAARAMGVTTAELNKMLETGKVTAEDLLPKLAAEMHKTFGPEAVKASGNLQASINKVKTEFFELAKNVGGTATPALSLFLDLTRQTTAALGYLAAALNAKNYSAAGIPAAAMAEEHIQKLQDEIAELERLRAKGGKIIDPSGRAVDPSGRIAEIQQYIAAYRRGANLSAQIAAKVQSQMAPKAATAPTVELTNKQRKALLASVTDWGDAMEFTQSQSNALDDALAKIGFEGGDLAKIQEHAKKTTLDWGDAFVVSADQGHELDAAVAKIGFEGGDLAKIQERARKTTVDWGDSMVLTEDQVTDLNEALSEVSGIRARIKYFDEEIAKQSDLVNAAQRTAIRTAELESLKARAVGDYTGFVKAQLQLQLAQMNTTWTGIANVIRDTIPAMSSTLSDGFFQLFTEGTVNAGDLFEDFTKRMARSLANFLADAAVKGFLGFALGLAGGGTILRLGGSGSDRIPALLSPGETVLSSGQTGVLGSLLKSIGALPEGAGGNLINTALGKALEKFGADIASLNVSQGGAPGLLFGLQEVPGHFEFPGQAATSGLLGSGGQVGQTGATLSQLSSAVAGVAGVFGGLSTVLSAQTEGGQLGGAVAMAGAVTAMMGNPLLGAGLAIVGALMPGLFGDEAAPARRAGRNRVSNDTLRATIAALDSGDLARDVGGLRAGDLVYTMAVEQLDNAFATSHAWPANPAFAAIRDRFGAAGFAHRNFNVGDVNSIAEMIGWSGTPTDAMNGFTTYTGVALWEDLLRSVATQLTGVQAPITQLPPLTSEGARQMLSNASEFPVDMTLAKFTLDRFGIPGYTIVQGGDPQDPYTKLVPTEETISGYGTGGVVDGPIGEPQLAVVHGGEEVLTPEQRAGRGGSVLVVQLVTPDRRVLAEQVIEGIKILDSAGHTGIPSSFVYTRRRN